MTEKRKLKGKYITLSAFLKKRLLCRTQLRYLVISSLMGVTLLGKTATSLPFSSTRNFVKFHLITGSGVPSFFASSERYLNRGWILSPTTSTFSAIGKLTP